MEFARISQNFAKFAEEQASEKHRAEKSLKITGKYSQSVEISALCDRMVGIGKHKPENGTGGGSQMGADPGSCRIQMQNTGRGARRFVWD